MDIESTRSYCLAKKCVTESFPFDDETLVFKVCNKMFALININPPFRINLKCDPELAVELRERYEEVIPGYHMNKTHWNTVSLEGSIPQDLLHLWIDNSYDLIVKSLKKSDREKLVNEN